MTEQPHHPGPVELVGDFLGASHEILPGRLWQTSAVGSLIESLGSDKPVFVISAIESPEAPGLAGFLRFPFDDGDVLPPEEILLAIGHLGALWLAEGRLVVHCLAGNNRSGLLAGMVLHSMNLPGRFPSGPDIVDLIQRANPHALYNETFRKFLEALP